MSRLGKCTNFSGCLLAYRGEETTVADGQPFVCAECGKPLTEVKPPAGKWIIYALIGVVAVAVLAGLAVAVPRMLAKKAAAKSGASTASAAHPARAETPERSEPSETPSPANPDKKGDAEPPSTVVTEAKINLSVDQSIKAEVLKRIDLMPGLTSAEKDKLYNSVERAKQMGLVITVGDVLALKAELEKPEIASLRREPLAVLVILGYADPKGDPKMNLQYSKDRADAVVAAIKKEFGDKNLVRAVAMGGSTLLDAQSMEKNRIAEVWVVLP